MASKRVASVKSAATSQNCMEALASAVLEWFLLFILFVYAAASYMITKFASYCGLNTPCLLCSRLDHVFDHKKVGYYWEMICTHHKTEIASLVLCHAHDKLADVHQMCESCLFSFATINKSNAETYRLLVGKLGEDSYSDIDEDTDSDDHELVRSGKRICACCNEPCLSKGYAKKLMLTRSFRNDCIDIDCSVQGHVSINRDTREITAVEQFHEDSHQKIRQPNQLTRVGYIKLKINSDTESEVLFSEDDAEESLLKTEKTQENKMGIHRVPTDSLIEIADPHAVISSSASNAQSDSVSAHDDSVSDSFVEQGLNKTKSIDQEIKETSGLSPIPELISFADMDSTTDDAATPHGDVAEEDSRETSKDDNFTPPDVQAASNLESSLPTTNGKSVEGSQQFSDNIFLVPNLLDLGDAYKLAVANRGKQFTGLLVEQWLSKDSSKVSQDLRNLFSQLSISRGLEHSLSDLSPKMSINSDELRTAEASSSGAFQSFQKRISLERNESGLSTDGSVVSEIEGETAMDRLKRQIDHDRKALSALYKELEEERNSSAESTNQAMAMINRLQEEKATLQMEALQYLRMMEEQAEYDMEALQKTNDLLSEREKEIQDLEAELEYFRSKYPNESPSGTMMEVIQRENGHEVTEIVHGDESMSKTDASYAPAETKTGILKNAAVEIEEEKLHILSCLEKLEKKLELSSKCREDWHLVNVNDPKVEANLQDETEEKGIGDLSGDCVVDDYDKAEQINKNSGQGNPCSTGHVESIDDKSRNQQHNDNGNIPSLKEEYRQLLERMEALESDHRFLEHTINCLQVGEEGLQFVQDIASHLRELRTAEAKDN